MLGTNVRLRARLIGTLVGLVSVSLLVINHGHDTTHHRPDFDHNHPAARFILQGRDPYSLIGPNAQYYNSWPLYYPLPTVPLVVPLAPLPVELARFALFGFAIASSPGTPWRYAIVASLPFSQSVWIAQWSPLLYAMWLVPSLAIFAVAKPNYAAAILGSQPLSVGRSALGSYPQGRGVGPA